ncbi:tripartite tricarboxylate transporter substrate-binding protein [Achromobacter piechaudii]|uniref:tripartite tricarboxylate transporter substrate-binding protein n=1 Tax=Achromobacter piechaudii TaxID=72556 RepID=UPI0022AB0014|nr:tripartite tricarboxylate transporter substrate-binding protein [Achromobacter piechaudii]
MVSRRWTGRRWWPPAGTPPEVIAEVNSVVQKVLTDPATIAMFTAEGSKAMGGSAQSAQQYILDEQKKWARLIREANIQTAA